MDNGVDVHLEIGPAFRSRAACCCCVAWSLVRLTFRDHNRQNSQER